MEEFHVTRAKRQAELLGMPASTASKRLKKTLFFNLLKKHSENICKVCALPIEKEEELTVEHILPWENRSKELFFDVTNIAYSHLKCNTPHKTRKGVISERRIDLPEGMSWCSRCEQFKSLNEFSRHSQIYNKVRRWCRECDNKSKYGLKPSEF